MRPEGARWRATLAPSGHTELDPGCEAVSTLGHVFRQKKIRLIAPIPIHRTRIAMEIETKCASEASKIIIRGMKTLLYYL